MEPVHPCMNSLSFINNRIFEEKKTQGTIFKMIINWTNVSLKKSLFYRIFFTALSVNIKYINRHYIDIYTQISTTKIGHWNDAISNAISFTMVISCTDTASSETWNGQSIPVIHSRHANYSDWNSGEIQFALRSMRALECVILLWNCRIVQCIN